MVSRPPVLDNARRARYTHDVAFKPKVLVVEDDAAMAEMVRAVLAEAGCGVDVARDLARARGLVERVSPDLLILDRNLPDGDGADFCRELRATPERASLPVIFLTGRQSTVDKVVGLKLGGDDYLAKPFHPQELLARVEALLRRVRPEAGPSGVLLCAGLELDAAARTVKLAGKPVALTGKELDLLQALVERRGRVLTRSFLISNVWGYAADAEPTSGAVDMVVVGLRKKLGTWASRIEAVRGHGYKLAED